MATGSQAAVQRRKPSRKVIGGMVRTRARPESQMIVVMLKGSQRTSQAAPPFLGTSISGEKSFR